MKKLILSLLAVVHLTIISAATPYICFTDLTSGPSTGNSDNTQPGQIAGQDGAIVTLWGKNLGAAQGASQVLVDGQNARIYSWGNASAPADLYSKLGLQMIEFQIPNTAANGLVAIKVVVANVTSNTLPFTIRSGNIYFLKTTGNDITGNGSWTNPWATLDNVNYTGALEKIAVGDIIYVCNGVSHTSLAGDRATIDFSNPGTETSPKAIVGYPGATALIGSTSIEKAFSLWVSGIGPTYNWVVAKLHLTGESNAASMYHNFRLIGNKITAPVGDGPTGAISGLGNHLYVLGNELTNIGFLGTSKLYHPIYIQSAELCSGPRLPTETDREIAWNYLHDNFSYDAINIYRECGSSAYMTNHRVHDNYIINQTGCGIRIGDYVVGENWIYNNVVINAGLGPDPTNGDEAMHTPVYIHAGWDTATIIHFYNNTIYGGGFTGGAAWSSSMLGFAFTHPFTLDFRNNIIVSTIAGIQYLNPALATPTSGVQKNLWFGAGTSPSWDTNPIGANPLFVNPAATDFHLQNNSPAKDAGVPTTATATQPLPLYDFDLNLRSQNGNVDLGAFENTSGSVLPVTWINVQAKRANKVEALISWQVRNEINAREYTVQYSYDGFNYTNACTINANNNGFYSCLAPATGVAKNYYRILLNDNDGRSNYSRIMVVNADEQIVSFQVWPNPARDYAILNYAVPPGKHIVITIYNSMGMKMMTQTFTTTASGSKMISLEKLSAGFYNLIINGDNLMKSIQLIKQ